MLKLRRLRFYRWQYGDHGWPWPWIIIIHYWPRCCSVGLCPDYFPRSRCLVSAHLSIYLIANSLGLKLCYSHGAGDWAHERIWDFALHRGDRCSYIQIMIDCIRDDVCGFFNELVMKPFRVSSVLATGLATYCHLYPFVASEFISQRGSIWKLDDNDHLTKTQPTRTLHQKYSLLRSKPELCQKLRCQQRKAGPHMRMPRVCHAWMIWHINRYIYIYI